jgi:hypothetical protein
MNVNPWKIQLDLAPDRGYPVKQTFTSREMFWSISPSKLDITPFLVWWISKFAQCATTSQRYLDASISSTLKKKNPVCLEVGDFRGSRCTNLWNKNRNGKTSQPTTIRRFRMHRNRRWHTYLRFPVSLPVDLAWLESARGPPLGLGRKQNWNEQMGQSRTFGRFLTHENRLMDAFNEGTNSIPSSLAWL